MKQRAKRVMLTCLRCQYAWFPKKDGYQPRECPSCKNRKWNVARKAA